MAGQYNTIQKNLLVAGDNARQAQRRLEYALAADERQDEPQLRPELRDLVERSRKLTEDINNLRERYDDGDFDRKDVNTAAS